MKYNIVSEKEVTKEQWWAYTDKHPDATLFHTPMMHEAFSGVPKLQSFALFAIDEDGVIAGLINGYFQRMIPVLPGILSKRIVIMQSPICDSEEVLKNLLIEYNKKYKFKCLFTEIRNHVDFSKHDELMKQKGFKFEDYLNIFINLSLEEETVWHNLSKNTRKRIKKSTRDGLIFKKLGFNEIEEAYTLLKKVYIRIKLPLFDISFFSKCFELSTSTYGLRVFGAYYKDKIIGARFALQYKGKMYAYFAGSDPEYYHLSPNEYLPWKVFQEAKKSGISLFDFGGAGKPGVPYGVRDYKMKFGGNLVNYGRYYNTYSKCLFYLFQKVFELRIKLKGLNN